MPDTPPSNSDPRTIWEGRYGATTEFVYGTEPNDFLAEVATDLLIGETLCLADGEGRNGVFLASLGHRVTSVDLTEAGMAKAATLAVERGVDLTTVVADLADYDLGTDRWDLVISIFAHTPPPTRRRVHSALTTALRPGGRLILEAYTPNQIGRGTGGPPVPELTMDLERLDNELVGLEFEHRAEFVRPVVEGPGHTGDGAVVQVIARRPV
ncbi:MAG: class I SAM-dependent methyltransferase [Acidimicrobiales bacterium]|nr:class I SAM-dependent methyltransferase [Acidimicrobiales bacterium]